MELACGTYKVPHDQVISVDLKHIKGIGPAKQEKYKAAGIGSVEELARADCKLIAGKTGMSEDTIREHQQRAVALNLVQDVKGIGPATLETLAAAGVQSIKDLYEASADFLAKEAEVAREKAQAWQAEAKRMADHIQAEAKTPEGRRKLAQEGREAVEAAAKKGAEVARDIYERAKTEAESAIAKAQQMRERAPKALHDARIKAEEALRNAEQRIAALREAAPSKLKEAQAKAEAAAKDAEAKVKDLQARVAEFVRVEAEKVKVANEGFFARIGKRFRS